MPKIPRRVSPYWQTTDAATVRLYQGNVEQMLSNLPSKSVHCCVTSPPYWGLRDYGNDKSLELGTEKTPQEYVDRIVRVFREIRRVLRDDGTLWLNLGDTYGGGKCGRTDRDSKRVYSGHGGPPFTKHGLGHSSLLPSGNLVGIPWRVALAMQADGWMLRQDIIWHKPSPMPESVRNRCTKSHEYVFLFTKRMGYYYDAEAIKSDCVPSFRIVGTKTNKKTLGRHKATGAMPSGNMVEGGVMSCGNRANKRSVWTVNTDGFPGAHFATFPPKLIEPCILAGTSERGCCAECGAPYKRVTEDRKLTRPRPNDYVKRKGVRGMGNSYANSVAGVDVRTLGWEPTCRCDADVIPCTVLDPFVGSGTTCVVALSKGRRSVGIDLSEECLRNLCIHRVEGVLLDRLAWNHLVPACPIKQHQLGVRLV